ncbi:hypothetical protein GCM10011409_15490 [Lentibacillus populi]|uniref:Uncharacterized protein n=1 Tax=Lentibacillus populi TaxID=1827502 RepID=A0A9W5TWC8_9BACI|nr:hypothetical protein [Lentibacillus populi]GGB38877.1 hypothetical protein GCM10011409_15490 [Lentibacillus populi]
MKKVHYLFIFTAFILIVLAGCGENSDSTEVGKDKKSGKDDQASYKELETIDLEGTVSKLNFSLDEDGNTLLWGENDGGLGDDKRRYVWVDGDVKELNIEKFDQFSILSGSGNIINGKTDWDAEVNKRHSILEYNPATDKTEEFVAENDRDDILLPSHGVYLQEPRTYIHTVTNTDLEDAETYIWNIDNNEFTDLNFIHDIKLEVGEELKSYPHFFLSADASMVYASVLDGGIFAYDIEAQKTETLLSSNNVLPADGYTTMLTSDGKYITYGVNDSDDENIIVTYHALDVDTKESIEIGKGNALFTLSDGNVIIVDENDIKLFDFETEELKTIHTIKLEENEEIDNVTVSLDGSTIAYGYTTKDEDDEESTSHIKILQNK